MVIPKSTNIQLNENESFTLPESVLNLVGSGDWLVTIEQIESDTNSSSIRDHQAFLNGYDPMDEGLYNDYTAK
ncbi:hypothetical protein C7H19_14985 [Aphanothece hegewaldii CCALA 016]|uniref:Uncharacterized protein n=1 Tax=Aphanothece hegewaldii CCALA 016 TaxID=2107694 RepID=A0A2T1LW19_9CHRO|nr:hypothetical protein C7H19_14985 [Aphanothece hegewaldii CCALA 016]